MQKNVQHLQEQRSNNQDKDVQILTLEDDDDQESKRGETFRRENGAEILELEEENDDDLVNEELKLTQRTRLEVLKEDSDEELIRSELATAEMEEEEAQRKISDNKEQQTDLTYAHVNKKIQTNTMEEDEPNSDIDIHDEEEEDMTDAASSVLSQSIRSTQSYHDPGRFYRLDTKCQGEYYSIKILFQVQKIHSSTFGRSWFFKCGHASFGSG